MVAQKCQSYLIFTSEPERAHFFYANLLNLVLNHIKIYVNIMVKKEEVKKMIKQIEVCYEVKGLFETFSVRDSIDNPTENDIKKALAYIKKDSEAVGHFYTDEFDLSVYWNTLADYEAGIATTKKLYRNAQDFAIEMKWSKVRKEVKNL